MLKAVIHALAFVLVGIVLVSASARATTGDRHSIHVTVGDVELTAVHTTDAAHQEPDDHGGAPCSHGACKACCGACAPALPLVAVQAHVLDAQDNGRCGSPHAPDQLVTPGLSLLPFRPPCAIA